MMIKSLKSDVLRNMIPLATEIAHCGVWKQDFERAKKHDLGVLHLVNRDPEYACCVSMMLLCVYFFLQINRLLDILLDSELNYENKYQRFRDKEDKTKKTLMHYAAELGFLDVTKTLAKKCPWLLTVATKAPLKKRGLIPVEIALEAENDEVTAYLIRLMYHER